MPIKQTYEECAALGEGYSHVPLIYEMSGDFDTPVSLYQKIRYQSPYSFLLESALQSGSSGRYSFIGFAPKNVIRCTADSTSIEENGNQRIVPGNSIATLRSLLGEYSIQKDSDLPRFIGGLVGLFNYDSVRFFESIPDKNKSEYELDRYSLLLVDTVIVYDHYHHNIEIVTIIKCGDGLKTEYAAGCKKINEIADLLKKPLEYSYDDLATNTNGTLEIVSNMTKDKFEKNVEDAKEFIAQGDIFQVVLSQQFSAPLHRDSFDTYRRLRSTNPSPYMFYIDINGLVVTGSSPEVLVKCSDGLVTTRPLAGTRPRGLSRFEDNKNAEELLKDKKERAEHVMLVDLSRNDLGRFCKFGSITIPEFMGIERYSHVMHIVSEVTGQLEQSKDSFDVLRGTFPAGTVSGAPKIRAMEIIDELEPTRRGIYAGAVGYIDFQDNIDTCIAIRTLFIKDKRVYIQAGAGIVADSVPENEYFETLHKAQALIKAVASAEGKIYDSGN